MALHRSFGPVLFASALAAGGLLPAAPASAAPAADPVSILALTTDDGGLTPVADDGLEALSAPAAQPQTLTQRSGTTTAQAASDASAPDTDDVAVLTAPVATPEFYVAGVTWDGAEAMPQDAALFIRVMENGQWQGWDQLEVEAGADDGGAVGGTEPYTAAGAEAVQVQITGDAARLPANIRLSLTPEWPSAEEVVLDEAPDAPVAPAAEPLAPAPAAVPAYQQPAAQSASTQQTAAASTAAPESSATAFSAAPRPSITSRAGWGANESMMTWRPKNASLRAAVVHHTAGTNNYTQAQSASIVRGIYHYHAVTRGWGDIGYNFLVDKWGRIYEGRSGTLAAGNGLMPVGAHAAPRNTNTMGLSVMGDYTKVGVPQVAMDALADLIAWQFGRAGLSATDRSGLLSTGTFARPAGQNLGRVFAHRDVSNTACPGDEIYSRMGQLARAADARIAGSGPSVTKPSAPASPTPNPVPTPPPAVGHVYLNNAWGPIADVDYAFAGEGAALLAGDWDGNRTDTLGTRRGNTYSVYNENKADAPAWTVPYGRANDEVFIGDWNGDGKDSLAVRRGATFYAKNKILSGEADYELTYGRPGDEVFVGDWDADGKDTFAVRRGSTLYVKNSITGGVADEVIAYGRPGDIMLVGDWNGNGADTFAVRRGSEYHVKNSIAGGPADRVITYGRAHDVVLVGDWNGDRTDTLGVYRPAL